MGAPKTWEPCAELTTKEKDIGGRGGRERLCPAAGAGVRLQRNGGTGERARGFSQAGTDVHLQLTEVEELAGDWSRPTDPMRATCSGTELRGTRGKVRPHHL